MAFTSDTVILISSVACHRIESAGGSRAFVAESLPRSPGETLAESVGMLVRSSSRRLGRVWIASTDAWVGEIELERRVAQAIGQDGLDDTLAFEAENLSGIPAFNSRVAYVPQSTGVATGRTSLAGSPGNSGPTSTASFNPGIVATSSYIVLQVDANELEAIETEIKERRGKLMGIGSTAILRVPTGAPETATTIVSELESGTILVRNLGGSSLTVMTADRFDLSRWDKNFGDSLGGPLVAESTIAILAQPPEQETVASSPECTFTYWDEPQLLLQWAQWWLKAIQSTDEPRLFVKPQGKPIGTPVWTALALGSALLVAVACGFWQYRAVHEVDRLTAQIENLRSESSQTGQLQRANDTTEKEVRRLREAVADDVRQLSAAKQDALFVSHSMEVRQHRWQLLLDAIASTMGPECFIESMRWLTDAVAIEGHAETAAAAHQAADRLGQRIGKAGWQVEPAKTEFNPNGLYRFRLLARPTDPASSIGVQQDAPASVQTSLGASHYLNSSQRNRRSFEKS